MIALHHAGAVFFFVERTASNALRALLLEHCDGIELDRNHHDMHLPPEWDGYTTHAVARNPYTHLASLYRRGLSEPKSALAPTARSLTFPEFARWAVLGQGRWTRNWRPLRQIDCLYMGGWPRVDVWLHYERLNEDLAALPFIGPDLADQLPRVNDSGLDDGVTPYDEETAALVYGWARADFERGGYDRESWRNP